MGFLDKAKAQAQQAATKAKEGVADVQTKRSLGQAYTELGEEAYRLLESGDLKHPQLEPYAERIRSLQAEGEPAMAGAAASSSTTTSSTEPPPSNQPPAMPT